VCLAPWDSDAVSSCPVGTVCSLAIAIQPIVNVLCTAQYLVREMDVSWNRLRLVSWNAVPFVSSTQHACSFSVTNLCSPTLQFQSVALTFRTESY